MLVWHAHTPSPPAHAYTHAQGHTPSRSAAPRRRGCRRTAADGAPGAHAQAHAVVIPAPPWVLTPRAHHQLKGAVRQRRRACAGECARAGFGASLGHPRTHTPAPATPRPRDGTLNHTHHHARRMTHRQDCTGDGARDPTRGPLARTLRAVDEDAELGHVVPDVRGGVDGVVVLRNLPGRREKVIAVSNRRTRDARPL